MTDDTFTWSREKQVLQLALERPPDERQAFVAQTCGGTPVYGRRSNHSSRPTSEPGTSVSVPRFRLWR